jgi:hypothetical protein
MKKFGSGSLEFIVTLESSSNYFSACTLTCTVIYYAAISCCYNFTWSSNSKYERACNYESFESHVITKLCNRDSLSYLPNLLLTLLVYLLFNSVVS